jgi:NAD(P)-dependent dehydrogenase (short-subunit alcohol dehydrogenase family)
MDLGLRGRVAVVACGSPAHTAACAQSLQDEQARVLTSPAITDRSPEWEVVAGADSAAALIAAAVERFGRVDVVVLGAVPATSTPVDQVGAADLMEAWSTVPTTVGAYQQALSTMIPNRWGRFVHLASSAAKSITPEGNDLDAMAALSILALHKIVANEFGGLGITANAVLHDDVASADTVAAAVTFFASQRAAYLTGLAMTVDDGAGSWIY